jgi:hypothetical protein
MNATEKVRCELALKDASDSGLKKVVICGLTEDGLDFFRTSETQVEDAVKVMVGLLTHLVMSMDTRKSH